MASLNAIAEIVYHQMYPSPDDENAIPIEVVQEASRLEYAYQIQLLYWRSKREDGEYELPSHLLVEKEVEVKNNEIDLCDLNVFRSFSSDVWLQNVGGFNCDCNYVRYTTNLASILCDEDSKGHGYKTYVPLGNKIKFPEGVHKNPLTIIYVSKGEGMDGDMEVDDIAGNLVKDALLQKYLGKVPPADVTNNSNPNS